MEGEFSLYCSVPFVTYTPVFLALQHSPHPRKRKKLDSPDEEWIPRCRSILVPSVPISPKWWPCTSSASGCLKTTLTVSHMLLSCSWARCCGTGTPGDLPLLSAFPLWFSAAIFEVGGVPYSLLEPVLERCTPDQLYRIEEYNHVSILLGWEEGSVLACISRSSFVSESATMMGRWWSDHCSGFVYGPLNRQVFSTCLWHLK